MFHHFGSCCFNFLPFASHKKPPPRENNKKWGGRQRFRVTYFSLQKKTILKVYPISLKISFIKKIIYLLFFWSNGSSKRLSPFFVHRILVGFQSPNNDLSPFSRSRDKQRSKLFPPWPWFGGLCEAKCCWSVLASRKRTFLHIFWSSKCFHRSVALCGISVRWRNYVPISLNPIVWTFLETICRVAKQNKEGLNPKKTPSGFFLVFPCFFSDILQKKLLFACKNFFWVALSVLLPSFFKLFGCQTLFSFDVWVRPTGSGRRGRLASGVCGVSRSSSWRPQTWLGLETLWKCHGCAKDVKGLVDVLYRHVKTCSSIPAVTNRLVQAARLKTQLQMYRPPQLIDVILPQLHKKSTSETRLQERMWRWPWTGGPQSETTPCLDLGWSARISPGCSICLTPLVTVIQSLQRPPIVIEKSKELKERNGARSWSTMPRIWLARERKFNNIRAKAIVKEPSSPRGAVRLLDTMPERHNQRLLAAVRRRPAPKPEKQPKTKTPKKQQQKIPSGFLGFFRPTPTYRKQTIM